MMLELGDDGVVTSVNEEDLIYVDKNELEEFIDRYKQLDNELNQIKHIIQAAYNSERTFIGKSVLKQLLEQIGVEVG